MNLIFRRNLGRFVVVVFAGITLLTTLWLNPIGMAQEVELPGRAKVVDEVKKAENPSENPAEKVEKTPAKSNDNAPVKKSDEKVPGVRPEPDKTDPQAPEKKGEEKPVGERGTGRGKPIPGTQIPDPVSGGRPKGTPGKPMPQDGEKKPLPDGVTGGRLIYDEQSGTVCGRGKICFTYRLPAMVNAAGNVTGTGVISLGLYQNGMLIHTFQSPVLTMEMGTSYCFGITPAGMNYLLPGVAGFDFVATGTFSIGNGVINTAVVGTAPNGRIPDQNNDYAIDCAPGPGTNTGTKTDGCCLGKNLVNNGDFEHGEPIPHSEYAHAENFDQFHAGTFMLTNVDSIGKACEHWQLPKACQETRDFSGNVMLVNGLTSQMPPAHSSAVIWEQHIALPDQDEKGTYRICFHYLPLPQCCFDVQSRPVVKVYSGLASMGLTNVSDVETGCGRLFSATFSGYGAVNLQIILPQQDVMRDGNDLLIDNISLAQLVKVDPSLMTFACDDSPVSGGFYTATATLPPGLTAPPYTWMFEILDASMNPVPGFPPSVNTSPAVFPMLPTGALYYVKLTVKSDCNIPTAVKRPSGQLAGKAKEPNRELTEAEPGKFPDVEPGVNKTETETPKRRRN